MTSQPINPAHIELLKAAIAATGLSHSAYARHVLTRDPRTCRRWLSGKTAIPKAVLAFLNSAIDKQAVSK